MTNSNGNNSDRLERIELIIEEQSQDIAQLLEVSREQGRSIAEQGRSIAEQGRSIAEQGRSIVEQGRSIAEQNRSIAQLAQAAQAALSMTQRNRESIERTEQLTSRNASAIARLEERMEQYIIEGREHREFIAAQVDGIKVETRRIIQHLFGEMDSE